MKLRNLDNITEGNAYCYLCKTNLYDFTSGLPVDFEDFFVQRGIVSNRYLDNLWDTISKGNHIPTIVLTEKNENPSKYKDIDPIILSNNFKVLDGLQRSKRLKVILDTINFINSKKQLNGDISIVKAAREFKEELSAIDSNAKLFAAIMQSIKDGMNPVKLMRDNELWLEVWVGLSEPEEIRKMLILNAGHKAVSIKHQIELLFLSYLSLFKTLMPNISITREKQISSIRYSKDRKPGQFHFPHLIAAFESLNAGESVLANADFSAEKTFADLDDESILEQIDRPMIVSFANSLTKLDTKFGSDGLHTQWLGREVVLVGIFGAVGSFAKNSCITKSEALDTFSQRIDQFHSALNLDEFEYQRNKLQLSKVNIGMVNRRAIFNATKQFLIEADGSEIDWSNYFPKTI